MDSVRLTQNHPGDRHLAVTSFSTFIHLTSRFGKRVHFIVENDMLHYAIVFLVIALIAAVFGFGGIAASAVGIAKILFYVFVIMAVITFVLSLLKKG